MGAKKQSRRKGICREPNSKGRGIFEKVWYQAPMSINLALLYRRLCSTTTRYTCDVYVANRNTHKKKIQTYIVSNFLLERNRNPANTVDEPWMIGEELHPAHKSKAQANATVVSLTNDEVNRALAKLGLVAASIPKEEKRSVRRDKVSSAKQQKQTSVVSKQRLAGTKSQRTPVPWQGSHRPTMSTNQKPTNKGHHVSGSRKGALHYFDEDDLEDFDDYDDYHETSWQTSALKAEVNQKVSLGNTKEDMEQLMLHHRWKERYADLIGDVLPRSSDYCWEMFIECWKNGMSEEDSFLCALEHSLDMDGAQVEDDKPNDDQNDKFVYSQSNSDTLELPPVHTDLFDLPDLNDMAVAQLCGMGFDVETANTVLLANGGNFEAALEILLAQ
eukprot:m.24883 g.24883  ORF g.24883 m.24883 type:complete len:387 (-) comp7655_c0_seq1:54-1214(-)